MLTKRLDLENEEVWSKAYLPASRTAEAQGNCEDKVIFRHVQIKLVASKEPLMGSESLPDVLVTTTMYFVSDGILKVVGRYLRKTRT